MTVKCEICIQALAGKKANFLNSPITKKSHDGLTYPSEDVCQMCKVTKYFLRVNEHNNTQKGFFLI